MDHCRQQRQLSEFLDKGPVVAVFYNSYYCNHCVGQLFALHNDAKHFQELAAQIIAISADSPELTQQRFAQYGPFAFSVLSDPGNKVGQLYRVFTPPKDGKPSDLLHGTFVIARNYLNDRAGFSCTASFLSRKALRAKMGIPAVQHARGDAPQGGNSHDFDSQPRPLLCLRHFWEGRPAGSHLAPVELP
jgi:peroxiredoxin